MAGVKGKSGPPGNQNAFRHGLAGIAQRRADGVLNPAEQSIREEILSGLLADMHQSTAIQQSFSAAQDAQVTKRDCERRLVVLKIAVLQRSLLRSVRNPDRINCELL